MVVLAILVNPLSAQAVTAGFIPGAHNEYLYEEMVFITGEPLKFTGSLDITEKDRDNTRTTTYKYNLTCNDLEEKTKLTRTITFITDFDERTDKGQAIASTRISRFSERVEIGRDRYELTHFQLSQSDIVDIKPVADFYSGNFSGRKVYQLNRGEGEVVVEISGDEVGYENFWGNTDTQTLYSTISSRRFIEDEEGDREEVTWEGTVRLRVSDSAIKTLRYSENDANLSSFEGGYIRTTEREKVARYEYDLPRMRGLVPDRDRRVKDTLTLSAKYLPNIERLVVPKFRDVRGHWAQSSIEKLYSLDVFDESPNFFTPEAPMTRAEFTKGIIRACDIRIPVEAGRSSRRRSKEPPEVSPFKDVAVEDEMYKYIKEALEKGIVAGVSPDEFRPQDPLTRAQAATIMMRALGFENRAPNPGYYTSFADDRQIPNWARDSIYMAREIGILQGDTANRVNPNKVLTRAEASTMLIRFLEFLQRDLQRDYRENIFFYN